MSETGSVLNLKGLAEKEDKIIVLENLNHEIVNHVVYPKDYDIKSIDLSSYLERPSKRSIMLSSESLSEIGSIYDLFANEEDGNTAVCFALEKGKTFKLYLDAPVNHPTYAEQIITCQLTRHYMFKRLADNSETEMTHKQMCYFLDQFSDFIRGAEAVKFSERLRTISKTSVTKLISNYSAAGDDVEGANKTEAEGLFDFTLDIPVYTQMGGTFSVPVNLYLSNNKDKVSLYYLLDTERILEVAWKKAYEIVSEEMKKRGINLIKGSLSVL